MPLLALGHTMALSLLTLMLGGALTTKPRATTRDATAMIRSLGFGNGRNAEPQPVDSAAVKLIKRGTEYDILKNKFSGVSDAIDEALNTAVTSHCLQTTLDQMQYGTHSMISKNAVLVAIMAG